VDVFLFLVVDVLFVRFVRLDDDFLRLTAILSSY